MKTGIPSPARSHGAPVTPRRYITRRTRSVGSPGRAGPRPSTLVQQFKENNIDESVQSPLNKRSILNDDTDIELPNRQSWWKKLDDNSRDVMEVLQTDNVATAANVLEEYIDGDVLSQEKKTYLLDLPDSSGSESIGSIVLPQRKLFTHKENIPEKKFGKLVGNRESLAKLQKTVTEDKTVYVGPKKLFEEAPRVKPTFPAGLLNISANKTGPNDLPANFGPKKLFGQAAQKKKSPVQTDLLSESGAKKQMVEADEPTTSRAKDLFGQGRERTKPAFPSGLLDISANKTGPNKTKELTQAEVQREVRSLFGNRPGAKRKNMFADFVVSESEEEIPDIQPKVFGLKGNPLRRESVASRGAREASPTSSIATDIEMDDWKMLPSSTMMVDQLEVMLAATPKKKIRLSQLATHKEVEEEVMPNEAAPTKKSRTANISQTAQNTSNIPEKVHEMTPDIVKEKDVNEQQNDDHNIENIEDIQELQKSTSKNVEASAVKAALTNKSKTAQNASNLEDKLHENNPETEIDRDEIIKQNNEENNDNCEELRYDSDNEDDMEAEHLEDKDKSVLKSDQEYEIAADAIKDVAKTDKEKMGEVCVDAQGENEFSLNNESIPKNNSTVNNQFTTGKNVSIQEKLAQVIPETEQNPEEIEKPNVVSNKDKTKIDEIDQELDKFASAVEDDNEPEKSLLQSDQEDEDNEIAEKSIDDDAENDEEQLDEINESAEVEEEETNKSHVESEEENVEEDQESDQSADIQQETNESPVQTDEEQESEKEEEEEDSMEQEVEENEESHNASVEENEESHNASVEQMEDEPDDNDDQDEDNQEEVDQEADEPDNETPIESNDDAPNEIDGSPNVTHDTTGRFRKKMNETKMKTPEAVRQNMTNKNESFEARGRNTSVRKTKSMIKPVEIRSSLARDSVGSGSDFSAQGSGWDSHRTTRKTIRQTFGKDFTPRKSLRALVMEKSAKRQTYNVDPLPSESINIPQANSTEISAEVSAAVHMEDVDVTEESDHEISRTTRRNALETYLQKVKQDTLERKQKMESAIRDSLKAPHTTDVLNNFKIPAKPTSSRRLPSQTKAKPKPKPSALLIGSLPEELIEELKYKPPKRFMKSNASWITKRLYKFLETKLEPKYDYKARVRAEKIVEALYNFSKYIKRHEVAPREAVIELKHEMARYHIVKTHFDFYDFFREFMPKEVKIKVVPDVCNKLPLPKYGVFADILRETVHG
ncbi:glutamic acid-rich protein [Plutella xylostella]|uniref:glutamic acid-rich protein n=1 Tax=Plutella xylostella TaxID=51655 RepID=UPI00203276A7|nr:glutamic acid-rich protein [Plutella xylostella]